MDSTSLFPNTSHTKKSHCVRRATQALLQLISFLLQLLALILSWVKFEIRKIGGTCPNPMLSVSELRKRVMAASSGTLGPAVCIRRTSRLALTFFCQLATHLQDLSFFHSWRSSFFWALKRGKLRYIFRTSCLFGSEEPLSWSAKLLASFLAWAASAFSCLITGVCFHRAEEGVSASGCFTAAAGSWAMSTLTSHHVHWTKLIGLQIICVTRFH